MKLLGVDTGGTFTDFVLFDGEAFHTHKRLSTPEAPEKAILEGIRALGVALHSEVESHPDVVHGSTVATNAVLEGKGARTAYVTNRGFGDILTIGRQARPDIYCLKPAPTIPPVAPPLCLETGGRIGAQGELIEDLSAAELSELQRQLAELAPDAVAINLLFSFIDDRFERTIEEGLKRDYFVSRSSRVLAEHGEYERGITTWLNSYVGPIMQRYLQRLKNLLPNTPISVMQSHGKTIAADRAADYAVHLLLSGPAGGVTAAQHLSAMIGSAKVLSFDMGGTSTDVSLIDGELCLTNEGHVGAYPVATPMVDIHTLGAGGGSIAYLDEGGMLRVGPQSAGASPGPACYGFGGEQPTVTDANLLLGRLPQQLGDALSLDRDAAARAFAPLAQSLDKSLQATAQGVIDVVNEQMGQALRAVSAQRGHDPAQFMLVGFGAAAGLHVCTLAENLNMQRAMIPIHAGVLSALGMLLAPRGLQKSRAVCLDVASATQNTIDAIYKQLEEEASAEMHAQGISHWDVAASADLRYRGQLHCLTLERLPLNQLEHAFHKAYEARHGYTLDVAVELVTLRLRVSSPSPLEGGGGHIRAQHGGDEMHPPQMLGQDGELPLHVRSRLAGHTVEGPTLIAEATATVYVKAGWRATLDELGNLRLERTPAKK